MARLPWQHAMHPWAVYNCISLTVLVHTQLTDTVEKMPLPALRAAATTFAPPAGSPAATPTSLSLADPGSSLGLAMVGRALLASLLSSPSVSGGVRNSASEEGRRARQRY